MKSSLSILLAAISAVPLLAGDASVHPMPLDDLLRHMVEADRERTASLSHYECLRRYTLENRRFHKSAEITARMTYTRSGRKQFEILSEKGPAIIRERVLRKMIEAEEEASSGNVRQQTQISPANYDFTFVQTENADGFFYVLDIAPKTTNKFLVRGRIWVDPRDFAVVRVEGAPAQNPSILIRNTTVVQRNAKIGSFWLPLSNRSGSDSFLFGHTDVAIDYSEYRVNPAALTAVSGAQ